MVSIDELFSSVSGRAIDLYGLDNIPDVVTGQTTWLDWVDQATLGWNDGIMPYYLVGPEDKETEAPILWFGPKATILSPYALVAIINSIFGESEEEFLGVANLEVIEALKIARNSSSRHPEDYVSVDAYWQDIRDRMHPDLILKYSI